MKSIVEKVSDKKVDKYPYVGVCGNPRGLTVLFECMCQGMCLAPGDSSYKIGYVSNTWNEDNFERTSSITITFES